MNLTHIAATISLLMQPAEPVVDTATDECVANDSEEPRTCIGPVCGGCSVYGPPWGIDCKITALGHGCAGFCGTGDGLGCTGWCW